MNARHRIYHYGFRVFIFLHPAKTLKPKKGRGTNCCLHLR